MISKIQTVPPDDALRGASALASTACPLCHTVDHTVTLETLKHGATWLCARCGQRWDAARLAVVAADAASMVARQS
jgi:hypothetical protein